MLQFHYCKEFETKIAGQVFEDAIRSKFAKLIHYESLKNIGSVSPMGNIYILKTSNPKTRTIIQEKSVEVGADTVINVFFVRDIIASKNFDHYWGKIVFPQLKIGDWLKYNQLSNYEEQEFIHNYLNIKNLEKNRILLQPPDYLTSWFKNYELKISYDIFENEDWVKYTLNDSESEGMRSKDVNIFRLALLDIIENEEQISSEVLKQLNGIEIKVARKFNVGVIYSKLKIDANKEVLILHNGAHTESQKQYWEAMLEYFRKQTIQLESNIETISRLAFRAYPKWTLKHDELWFAIQKNNEISNLSLLPEQINFLKHFKFPCYINGQAGSGKSTMLYYLFANAYYFKCAGEIKGDIIFLTENETLLKQTNKAVFDLLTNNPEFEGLPSQEKIGIDNCFASFKNFLLNLLPEETRYKFDKSKYLDFPTFKNLYQHSNLPNHVINNYSAEEAWFTIITYIYGYDSKGKITSYEYLSSDIYKKSRIIPKERFEGIEKHVLPYYEKLINDEAYWDKLKIIRYIENSIDILPRYTILVCDEAQDFCRVELRFILRMSIYVQYDLSNIEQVPVVFAGDPNQTVNPTGFREKEIIGMLYEELKEIAHFNYDTNNSIFNPSFNYRSAQSVVTLANYTQYYRKKLLGIQLTKPQEAKRPEIIENLNFNTFFKYSSIIENKDLIEKLKYKVFIVPVDYQEKEEFKSEIELFSLLKDIEIKTAVEAKGAEYQQVVLCGFGDYYLKKFGSLSFQKKQDKSYDFQERYFFNKLYVGITRAQTELIIIDSEESEGSFWKNLIGTSDITENEWTVLNRFKDNVIQYNPDALHVMASTPEVAYENAKKDKEQGIYDKNAARLKVAANQYYKLGHKSEYFICSALAEELKNKWLEAARYYMNDALNNLMLENAAQCLWKGKLFNELIEKIGNTLKSPHQNIRLLISRLFMRPDEKLFTSDINYLYETRHFFREILNDTSWRVEIIERLMIEGKVNRVENEDIRKLADIFEEIAESREIEFLELIGNLHYLAYNYDRAVDVWEKIDCIDNRKFAEAKIQIVKRNKDFKSEIIWTGELLKYEDNIANKQTIELEIIKIHNENFAKAKFEGYENIYYLYVYEAFLIHQPFDNVDIIGKLAEQSLASELPVLLKFYENLLKSVRLNYKVAEYVIDRWAKVNSKLNEYRESNWLSAFNETYKQFAELNKIIFRPFLISEIEEINIFPEPILKYPPEKLTNLTIGSFRKFKNLELSNLGQFNLIVGDNNIGKTSLLEALLFSADKDNYMNNLAFSFNERRNNVLFMDEQKEERVLLPKNFADDYFPKDDNSKKIQLIQYHKRNLWKYTLRYISESELFEKTKQVTGLSKDDFIGYFSQNDFELIDIPLMLKNLKPEASILCPLIPFGKGFGSDLAQVYYDEIDRKKMTREQFLRSMKTFIPNIERISVDTEAREIRIEEKGFDEDAPLHQYGEGANKLFRILVQLSLQKDKRLLIDEIDSGIHFSRFGKFWKTILEVANKYNTQIFATTHNIECINYFKDILLEDDFEPYQSKSRIITLREFPNKQIKAYSRTFEEFEYALDFNMDIRGGNV